MDVIVSRCAAIDIAKREVVACVRVPSEDGKARVSEVRKFKTFTRHLRQLVRWFIEQNVTHVAMESTGKYWLGIWYELEAAGWRNEDLFLVNAQRVKMVPGRKTDVKDSEWLCQLLECGLLNPSMVPPKVIRQLRDLTRERRKLVQERTRVTNRIEAILEDAQIKITSVMSKTLTMSGRAMIEALIKGERTPAVLADMALGRLRPKIADLQEALEGRFDEHHAFMLQTTLAHIDFLDGAIDTFSARIEHMMNVNGMAAAVRLLCDIPGVDQRAAQDIIAEIGTDMSRFRTAKHLASWARICPALNESAGKPLPGGNQPKGNPWLGAILNQCAWAARRTKDTYLAARFRRIERRRGRKKAAKAVAHSILTICWHLLSTGETFRDLGGDWYQTRNPKATANRKKHLVAELEKLGFTVSLAPNAGA